MASCSICKTTWSSAGMTLCPMCGAKVEGGVPELVMSRASGHRESGSNGAAIAMLAPERPKTELRSPQTDADTRLEIPVMFPVTASTSVSEAPTKVQVSDPPPPAPPRPSNAPLFLGLLALVPGLLLPATLLFEGHRILGILGFCLTGFMVPFAPIGWMAGLSAEKSCRAQCLRPGFRIVFGRVLGQAGTLLLTAEVMGVLLLIAGLRLAGRFPVTFWSTTTY